MTSKLRSKPPIASADDFIAGAAQRTAGVEQTATSQPPKRESKPQAAQDKEVSRHGKSASYVDVLKVYNLDLRR